MHLDFERVDGKYRVIYIAFYLRLKLLKNSLNKVWAILEVA